MTAITLEAATAMQVLATTLPVLTLVRRPDPGCQILIREAKSHLSLDPKCIMRA